MRTFMRLLPMPEQSALGVGLVMTTVTVSDSFQGRLARPPKGAGWVAIGGCVYAVRPMALADALRRFTPRLR